MAVNVARICLKSVSCTDDKGTMNFILIIITYNIYIDDIETRVTDYWRVGIRIARVLKIVPFIGMYII